jgi:diaminohydroxyphosphoribosylaminopyrimidine deaminase/5-amino-6-(5-phosphoribosylamino)uracil reductase
LPAPLTNPALDLARLRRAVELATTSFALTEPNPRVGCVIGLATGEVIAEGATQQAGGPHAEVMALRAAATTGHDVRGATAWVSLEPCAHWGRTPPCCDALIAAGIGRVVAALEDPFPQVAGRGLARLRAAGVEVCLAQRIDGGAEVATAAREVNIGFFSRVLRRRPWVRLKMAVSLDGRTALADGSSRWITGAAARADGHAFRRRATAVVTGLGTALADDPELTVREVPTPKQPLRIVLDTRLRLPPAARLLAAEGSALIVHGPRAADDTGFAARAAALEAAGAERLEAALDTTGRIALPALLEGLAQRPCNELHVEAGPVLAGAMLEADAVDELLLYVAPVLVGPGRPLADLPPLAGLASARRFELTDLARVGEDLRLVLRPPGRAAFG